MKTIFDDDYIQIVESIKKARLSNDVTQTELAEKLGVTQSYISKIEQGQTRLDIIQLKKIAKALKINIEELI